MMYMYEEMRNNDYLCVWRI